MARRSSELRELQDQILSIEEVAEQTPWSKSTLYREAPKPDSPFWKRGGRWVTTEKRLLEWVVSGAKPQRDPISADPMPGPARARRGQSFRAQVVDLHSRRAS